MPGQLYICPTPIGNLEDITIRGLRILREVDLIACEDTRRTGKLLAHYEIDNELTSYHEHNERKRARQIISRLESGEDVALVADAGMPGISDPAYHLIRKILDSGLEMTVLPGPSAFDVALVSSGLPTERFSFEGFLPARAKKRRERLRELILETRTLLFYEAPHRLTDCLRDMLDILGDRRAVVARELSKRHEEIRRDRLAVLLAHYQERTPRGEITVVVEGRDAEELQKVGGVAGGADLPQSILEHLYLLMDEGLSKKKAIAVVARERGLSRSEVYSVATQIRVEK